MGDEDAASRSRPGAWDPGSPLAGAPPAAWRPEFDWLLDDLAVGGRFPFGTAARIARDFGIGAVIDVRVEESDRAEELAACGLTFLHLPTEDLAAVGQGMLDEGVAFANAAAAERRRLLIHCRHGIGRSATVALCVLVDRGRAPLEALSLAKDARERISPSPAQYEAWAEWLRRRGLTDSVPSFEEFARIAYRHLRPFP